MTKLKPVTTVNDDGMVIELATNSVIGYKCTQCSTAHIADNRTKQNIELFSDWFFMTKNSHRFCGIE